jgi:twitching motility two-component system response regulator PilG
MAHSDPSRTHAPSVVILSSEETLRDAVAYWFRSLSIPTVATADGYEANRELKNGSAGLLITDRLLPPWPGLGTFRELQSANPSLRVAYVDDGSWDGAILARIAGATVVLPRPLDRRRVIEALGRPELLS